MTGSAGLARTVLTLRPKPGITKKSQRHLCEFDWSARDVNNLKTELMLDNPAKTRFSGVMLDNDHTPIPEMVVTLPGTAL